MKNQKIKLLVPVLLSVALTLTACGTAKIPNTTTELQQSESSTVSDIPKTSAEALSSANDAANETAEAPSNTRDTTNETEETPSSTNDAPAELEEQFIVQSTPNDSDYEQLEYWGIDEFEIWMEQQYKENQHLADSHDKSFYDKDVNGDYYCQEWTQEDIDALYKEWQEQLELMKQGYQFTKSIPYSNDGVISGVFGPEASDPPVSAPGSTIITLPDGSVVDLGHFDTADEAAQAVEQYLTQQVKAGTLTQDEADNILEHGAIE